MKQVGVSVPTVFSCFSFREEPFAEARIKGLYCTFILALKISSFRTFFKLPHVGTLSLCFKMQDTLQWESATFGNVQNLSSTGWVILHYILKKCRVIGHFEEFGYFYSFHQIKMMFQLP
jgi:hypothetical protein